MIPKRVLLENFLSHGQPPTEFIFDGDEPLWVLCGPNGVGKSAVFDAITYALFGAHRGGTKGADQLIRHGSNGFRVVFDFRFDSVDYRITRTRVRNGRTTQKVERCESTNGDWSPVANVNSAADIQGWTQELLGLGMDQFTASILLRQGEADRIITAGGPERLALLKKIIGAERFAELSDRVHDAAKTCKDRLSDLQARKDGLVEVSEAELSQATENFKEVGTNCEASHESARLAAERVQISKRWVRLDNDRQKLIGLIAAADLRAAAAATIRTDKTRLDDLSTAVPILRQSIILQTKIATATQSLETQKLRHSDLTTKREELSTAAEQERRKAEAHKSIADNLGREAKQLRTDIDRETKFVAVAGAVKKLRDQLGANPSDLSDQLTKAKGTVETAENNRIAAGLSKAEAAGLLRQAEAQQKKFMTLGVGVKCSLCGQKVTAEHAERERSRIAAEIDEYTGHIKTAGSDQSKAQDAKSAAEAEVARLDDLARRHLTASTQLAEKEQTLRELGITADAGELQTALDAKALQAASLEEEAATAERDRKTAHEAAVQFERERTQSATIITTLEAAIQKDDRAIIAATATADSLAAQLSADWQSQLATLDLPAIDSLDDERSQLANSGVADQFRELESDANLRAEWDRQLGETETEIADIPIEARIAVADAELAAGQAKSAATTADKVREAAKSAADDLHARANEYRSLTKDIAIAERKHDLHRKLDELLGKTGLQREIVRSAEHEIVHLANSTVQNLSDGDLSIELDAAEDTDDKAFSLQVRRAADADLTPVVMLSGSQKFRVAVAIALAIGRYAAGQARPLESVIIDEGFGSLDKDGLRAMADELNQLQRTLSLRRIILVSHQEEFYRQFRVGYRLAHGETGAIATPFRQ